MVTVLFLCAYLLPSLIVQINKHKHTLAIQSINIFLGWTIVGWLIALAWAVNKGELNDKRYRSKRND